MLISYIKLDHTLYSIKYSNFRLIPHRAININNSVFLRNALQVIKI